MNERGSAWIGWKLPLIIIAVLVLVVIIYFTVSGTSPPLEKIEGAFNRLLIFIGIIDSPPSGFNCQPRFVYRTPGGVDFMKELGVSQEVKDTMKILLCEDECRLQGVSFEGGEQNEGSVFAMGEKELDFVLYFDGKMAMMKSLQDKTLKPAYRPVQCYSDKTLEEDAEIFRDIYSSMWGGLSEDGSLDAVKDFYDERFTARFILQADFYYPVDYAEVDWSGGKSVGENVDKKMGEIYAVWENENWEVFIPLDGHDWSDYDYTIQRHAKSVYYGPDTNKAINIFRSYVDSEAGAERDARVLYVTSPPRYLDEEKGGEIPSNSWAEIGDLVGGCADYEELDCSYYKKEFGDKKPDEVDEPNLLKAKFIDEIRPKLRKSFSYTEEELGVLNGAVEGKSFFLDDGTKFNFKELDFEKFGSSDKELPIIVFSSDIGTFGLRFYSMASPKLFDPLKSEDIALNHLPLELVQKKDGGWVSVGDDKSYKVSEDFQVEDQRRICLIKKFLSEVCYNR